MYPPRSNTPPLIVSDPPVHRRSFAPLSTNEPASTSVSPVYVFAFVSSSNPPVVFVRPTVPASTALTKPRLPAYANPVETYVPFCTVPPFNVTRPVVFCVYPPRSNTPPVIVSDPPVHRRSFAPLSISEPASTNVSPV